MALASGKSAHPLLKCHNLGQKFRWQQSSCEYLSQNLKGIFSAPGYVCLAVFRRSKLSEGSKTPLGRSHMEQAIAGYADRRLLNHVHATAGNRG